MIRKAMLLEVISNPCHFIIWVYWWRYVDEQHILFLNPLLLWEITLWVALYDLFPFQHERMCSFHDGYYEFIWTNFPKTNVLAEIMSWSYL
jgi:hypothetical protein